MNEEYSQVLDVAALAGHILLENGAEISRVEDTMNRISSHYGVNSVNFFVLSNGIFTTGPSGYGKTGRYANVEFIPIKGVQLDKVSAVSALSYDICSGKYSLEEAWDYLHKIRNSKGKPIWESTVGSALGAAGFCAVFGGGLIDCAAAGVVGLLLNLFINIISGKYLSKIVGGMSNAILATILCVAFYRLGFGESLSNMVIGSLMPLIPGVPFVNGVRDLADSDYIAGLTRLTDAMLGFCCIALGVIVAFRLDGLFFGGMIVLDGMTTNPQTAALWAQASAAFIGTSAFAVLFGVERNNYITTGIIGALGWLLYLLLIRHAGFSILVSTMLSTMFICLLSRVFAVLRRCPSTIFLLCGIFPLVPGAGVFWTTYYLASKQFHLSLGSGWTALTAAGAIVLGIIVAMEVPQKFFKLFKRK